MMIFLLLIAKTLSGFFDDCKDFCRKKCARRAPAVPEPKQKPKIPLHFQSLKDESNKDVLVFGDAEAASYFVASEHGPGNPHSFDLTWTGLY